MLNENKVILMTKMASYEEREGRRNLRMVRYFRGDYVGVQLLKAFLCVTFSYLLVFALYILYHLEMFMEDIYNIDLVGLVRSALMYYLIALAGYAVLTYLVYTVRYVKARKSLRLYYKNLKKLNSLYHEG